MYTLHIQVFSQARTRPPGATERPSKQVRGERTPEVDVRADLSEDAENVRLFHRVSADMNSTILSYLSQLELLEVQKVSKKWLHVTNKSAYARTSLEHLDLGSDVVGHLRWTRGGRSSREWRRSKLLHRVATIVRSVSRMGVVKTVYFHLNNDVGIAVNMSPDVLTFLEMYLHAFEAHGLCGNTSKILKLLESIADHIVVIRVRCGTVRDLKRLVDKSPHLTTLELSGIESFQRRDFRDMFGVACLPSLTHIAFGDYRKSITLEGLELVLRACPNLLVVGIFGRTTVTQDWKAMLESRQTPAEVQAARASDGTASPYLQTLHRVRVVFV